MKGNVACAVTMLLTFVAEHNRGQKASDGIYTLEQATHANGGGTSINGVSFMDGTSGQPIAGRQSNGPLFSIRGGFWNAPLTPTAASVSVSGRMLTDAGLPIGRVQVTSANGSSVTWRSFTSSMGYFRMDDVPVVEAYLTTASNGRYTFVPKTVNTWEETILQIVGLPHQE